jgi:hypothetical protein
VRAFLKPLLILVLCPVPLLAQSNSGELRLKVTDPDGLGVKSSVELSSDSTQFHRNYSTDASGGLTARNMPFGRYHIQVEHEGFSTFSGLTEVRSSLPIEYIVKLSIAAMSSAIQVTAESTMLDPDRAGTINRVDSQAMADRTSSLPGRSLPDLVSSQPGWVYEGSAVLHPRGSEYQTQFVIDGVPLTDNRSPASGPEIEADDAGSLTVYTAGIPAEYGRKMGGVVEVDTSKDSRPGLHGQAVLTAGSFGTANAYLLTQHGWGKNTAALSADGAVTDRYLNPPVIQNYTNTATTADFSVRYERELTNHDRVGVILRRELSKFLVPDEQLQYAARQLQHRENFETLGILSYQHVFSSKLLADLHFMMRDDTDRLTSNPQSAPIIAFQDRGFREEYLKGSTAYHRGRHEFKAGFEVDFTQLGENFRDVITDQAQFDPGTPIKFTFPGVRSSPSRRLDLEQSAFVQDLIHLGNWTASLGLRWDHYQLLANQNALSPRLGVARYFPEAGLIVHLSYDRVFQTPAFENILLASSPEVVTLNPSVLRLPVEPSHGNYYEVGATKAFVDKLKLDVNYFRRYLNNFADDDQLLNTAVSFPIAFRKAYIYGAEAKLNLSPVHRFSGFVSYSYQVGSVYLPVTGGLFLGSDATNALINTNGRLWDSQDQRHTLHARVRYQLVNRVWIAFGGQYSSGLPTQFDSAQPNAIADAVAQYGQAVVDRVNFAHDRVKPSLSLDASTGIELWKKDTRALRLAANIENLNNRLNVFDFAGLFSGNAIAPPRSYSVRFQTTF